MSFIPIFPFKLSSKFHFNFIYIIIFFSKTKSFTYSFYMCINRYIRFNVKFGKKNINCLSSNTWHYF